jgi:hypothetical protein
VSDATKKAPELVDLRDGNVLKTPPISAATPAQVGSVVGVDRMDVIDRARQHPLTKLELLCIEMKNTLGRDPRGGGFAFVARPRVVLQLLLDLDVKSALQSVVRLQEAVVIGERDSDVVGWWQNVPIIVRSTCIADRLFCLDQTKIPLSSRVDRQRAGQLRMAAHYGKLATLREQSSI